MNSKEYIETPMNRLDKNKYIAEIPGNFMIRKEIEYYLLLEYLGQNHTTLPISNPEHYPIIIEIDIPNNRAKVKELNMVKKHIKTTKEKKGGIVSKENFIHISNLKLLNEKKVKKVEAKK